MIPPQYKVNSTVVFPVISICTYARVNSTEIQQYNISSGLLSFMFSAFKGLYLFYNEGGNQMNDLYELQKEYEEFLENQSPEFRLSEFFLQHGTKCEQFLSACMFQGNDFTCCDKRYMREVLTDIGKCFVVTPPVSETAEVVETATQSIPGQVGGLKIYISIWEETYPETYINTNPDEGVQIHISHPDDKVSTTSKPIVLLSNTHALVELSLVNQILEKQTDSSTGRPTCTKDMELDFFQGYTPESCFAECVATLTKKKCECIQIGTVPMEFMDESEYCSPMISTECVQPLLQDSNRSFLWDYFDIKQVCNCPLKCNRWYYETLVSYSTVPSPGFSRSWVNSDDWLSSRGTISNYSIDKDSFIILDVYFNSLIYRVVDEQGIFGFNNFLSSTGGQLSIWLGIRVVTVFQVLYYLMAICYIILPVVVRRILDTYGWVTLARAGTVRQFKKPVALYPTASQGLFDKNILSQASIILSYPGIPTSSRGSSFYSNQSRSDTDDLMSRQASTKSHTFTPETHLNAAFEPDCLLEKDEDMENQPGPSHSKEHAEIHVEKSNGDIRL